MPAKTDRRHRQGLESRQRILEATLAIAAERGYDGTTMAQITERAELPASSVYWQFKNKDVLLAEALEYSYRLWRAEGPTWQSANYTGTPRERICTRLRFSLTSIAQQPEFWRLGLMVTMLRGKKPIAARERFLTVRGETQAIIENWWRSVLPEGAADNPGFARLLTRSYLAFVDGMFVAHRARPDIDLEALTEVIGEALADAVETWSTDPDRLLALASPGERGKSGDAPEVDDSRTRLLVAAEQICAERGYRGTTISRVCARAELPVSSLYWFFTDKDELVAEVVQHSWDDWVSRQPSWEQPSPGQAWPDALRSILGQSVGTLLDAPSFMRIGHMLTLEQQETEVAARARFLAIREEVRVQLSNWFSTAIGPTLRRPDLPLLCADAVIAFTDGFFLGTQIDSADIPIAPFVELVVCVLERAVAGNA